MITKKVVSKIWQFVKEKYQDLSAKEQQSKVDEIIQAINDFDEKYQKLMEKELKDNKVCWEFLFPIIVVHTDGNENLYERPNSLFGCVEMNMPYHNERNG